MTRRRAIQIRRSAFATTAAYADLPPGWVLQQSWVNGPVSSISFANVSDGWAVLDGDLIKTTNGGTTWNAVATTGWPDGLVWSISFATPQVGWAVGNYNGIWKTVDGGSTWTVVTLDVQPGRTYHHVQALDAQHVWAVGYPLLVFATSDGSTWTTQTADYSMNGGGFNRVHMVDSTHGWAAGTDGLGAGIIFSLRDNGHWTADNFVGSPTPDRGVSGIWNTDPLNGWAATLSDETDSTTEADGTIRGCQIWHTTDGLNWHEIASQATTQDPTAIIMLDTKHGFLGAGGIDHGSRPFLETTDGGVTWTGYNPAPTDAAGAGGVLDFALVDSKHVWAGGGWGMVDPGAVWVYSPPKGGKARLGEPLIAPQFPKTPYTVEDHDWIKAVGSVTPSRKRGTYAIWVVTQKKVRGKWVTKRKFPGKLSKSGYSYSTSLIFSSTGSWRIYAIHGSGKTALTSSYTNYHVIVDDWDIP